MLPNVTKMLPKKSKSRKKSQKYYCECCDYYSSRKNDYLKHLATQKHKKNMLPNVTKTLPKSVKSVKKSVKIFVCEHCNKEYKSRKGLWGHKKRCMPVNLENNAKVEELEAKLQLVMETQIKQNGQFIKKQGELMAEALKKNDIVICTALIPGKPAPRILTEDLVKLMKPGSIIYDLAAEQGGNSAFSEAGKINSVDGIKIIGVKSLMNRLPLTASSLYAKNLFSFIRNLYSKEKKDFNINLEDEIIEKSLMKEV